MTKTRKSSNSMSRSSNSMSRSNSRSSMGKSMSNLQNFEQHIVIKFLAQIVTEIVI